MIDLGFDDIEQAVVEALDRILANADGPGWRVADDGCVLDKSLWARLADLLVSEPGKPADERLSLLTCELAAERLGRTLVGLPMIDHLVGLRLLEEAGGVGREILQGLGRVSAPLALVIPAAQSRDAQPPLSLSGAIAPSILRVLPEGVADYLETGEAGLPYVANLGDLPVGRAPMSDGRWRSVFEGREALVEVALAERRTLVAGALAGICDRALELAVDYANERELFGIPIGAFQSLAHGLAVAKVQTDGSQLLAREAAWARDHEPERFIRLSRMTYAYAAAAGDLVTRTAVHIFGGYGLTREYPAQAYFRMARTLCLFVGDRRLDLQKIGRNEIEHAGSRRLVGA